jgi:uncharacterized protein (TIGR03083 family)
MTDPLEVLATSAGHLRDIVEGLEPQQLDAPAYPAEWTIAAVLSHLGSGAVVFQRFLEDALAGSETPSDFAPSVWAEWDEKSSPIKATDSLLADRALLRRLGSLTDEERTSFRFVMGPLSVDFPGFVCLRLNEHTLHTWDIEVTLAPRATLPPRATALVVDRLQTVIRYTGQALDTDTQVAVRTSEPRRDFSIALGPDFVSLTLNTQGGKPDLELPAEAFVRLVYGRLDSQHTPPVEGDIDLDTLRNIFPGP